MNFKFINQLDGDTNVFLEFAPNKCISLPIEKETEVTVFSLFYEYLARNGNQQLKQITSKEAKNQYSKKKNQTIHAKQVYLIAFK